MSWNVGNIRSLFLKLISKLVLFLVLTTPKSSPENLTLILVEEQQWLNIKITYSKEENFCLKWTKYNDRRKVCVHFKSDTDIHSIFVYRYQNKLYLKDDEIDLKMRE